MRRTPRVRGYTLIELLVAITLAGLVAVIGAVVLRAAIDFHGRANGHLRESEDLRAADRLLAREWSGRRETGLIAQANKLEFQSDRLYAAGAQGAAKVLYLCAADDAGRFALERRLLSRAEPLRAGAAPGSGGPDGWRVVRTDVLVTPLLDCGFAYLQTGESRGAKVAQWRADTGPGQPAPQLIRLRLATQRGEIAPLVYAATSAEG